MTCYYGERHDAWHADKRTFFHVYIIWVLVSPILHGMTNQFDSGGEWRGRWWGAARRLGVIVVYTFPANAATPHSHYTPLHITPPSYHLLTSTSAKIRNGETYLYEDFSQCLDAIHRKAAGLPLFLLYSSTLKTLVEASCICLQITTIALHFDAECFCSKYNQ